MRKFKLNQKVEVAEWYLQDSTSQFMDTSKFAVVVSEPKDEDKNVLIKYESGAIDYVPRESLEIIL